MIKNMTILMHYLFLSLLLTINTSCGSINMNNDNHQYYSNPKVISLINNPQSMTKSLQSLKHKLSIKKISDISTHNQFTRIISMDLDGTSVLIGLSTTDINSPTFYDILSHANTNPIGNKLFAPNSKIHRKSNIQISIIDIKAIDSEIVKDYLIKTLKYNDNQKIIIRQSIFESDDHEQMYLTEYVLPSIINFLSTKLE